MCFGGKSKSSPPTPQPTQPTRFDYTPADTSNTQQRAAAIQSSTANQPASFGAELGTSGGAAAVNNGMATGGM